jgi:hypothetical protein
MYQNFFHLGAFGCENLTLYLSSENFRCAASELRWLPLMDMMNALRSHLATCMRRRLHSDLGVSAYRHSVAHTASLLPDFEATGHNSLSSFHTTHTTQHTTHITHHTPHHTPHTTHHTPHITHHTTQQTTHHTQHAFCPGAHCGAQCGPPHPCRLPCCVGGPAYVGERGGV